MSKVKTLLTFINQIRKYKDQAHYSKMISLSKKNRKCEEKRKRVVGFLHFLGGTETEV